MKSEIERAEINNQLYRMHVRNLDVSHIEYGCTLENINIEAPKIMYAVAYYSRKCLERGCYYTDDEIFRAYISASLPHPNDNISHDKLWPHFVTNDNISISATHNTMEDTIKQFISHNKSLGVNDILQIAKLVDESFPGLTNKQLGDFLPAKKGGAPSYAASRKQGQRLRERYKAKYGPLPK